jgi:hypothetical protein
MAHRTKSLHFLWFLTFPDNVLIPDAAKLKKVNTEGSCIRVKEEAISLTQGSKVSI